MENNTQPADKKRTKKKRSKAGKVLLILLILALLGAGCWFLYNGFNTDTSSVSVTRYRTSVVTEGEVNTTLSGSSTLTVTDSYTATAPADAVVESINYAPGETVPANAVFMTLSSETVDSELSSLYTELQTAQKTLTGTTKTRSNYNVTAPRKGIVKDIKVTAGSACEGLNYLCVISTDGLMRVIIDRASSMKLYDTVAVTVNGTGIVGTVSRLTDDKAYITVTDDGYSIGAKVTVTSLSGESYGSGELEANDGVLVMQSFGQIAEVKVTENQTVGKNAVLFTLTTDTPSDTYHTRLESVRDIEDEIAELKDSLVIKWENEGMLATLSVAVGDSVTSGATLCYLTKTGGYNLSLAIDESDVSSVKVGQDASITLDALDGTYSGSVTNISYSGSGSYITSYTATVTTEEIENALPGMSATASVITSSSGQTLVVPVSAVQYDGDTAYLLKAGGSAVSSTGTGRTGHGKPNATASDSAAAGTDSAASDSAATAAASMPSTPTDGTMPSMPTDGSMPSMPTDGTMPSMPTDGTMPSMPTDATAASSDTASSGTASDTESSTGIKGIFNKVVTFFKNVYASVKKLVTGDTNDEVTNARTFNEADYERIYVTTGMSDGSYIAVSGDDLTAGTIIVYPVLETTAKYTASTTTTTTSGFNMGGGNMGGMPSGGMPNMGGGNMGGGNWGNRG